MINIIPAIDIIDGKCVRLTKGDYHSAKVYDDNPVDTALRLQDAGCRRLHLVDLDGAKASHIINYHVLERIANATNLTIDFGGGLKHDDDIRIAFDSGAAMVTCGSIAVKSPELLCNWIKHYGAQRIILGADARNGKVSISGWTSDSNHDLVPFITDWHDKGISTVIATDINADGTLCGPSFDMYRHIQAEIKDIDIIASGGVGSIADLHALNEIGLSGVIVGKALYEGRITYKDIEQFNI